MLGAYGFLFDLALCAALVSYFSPEESLWLALVVFGTVQLAIIAWLIKAAVWGLFAAKLGARTLIANSIYGALSHKGFPPPEADEDSPSSYFGRMRNDESLPIETRLNAAAEWGAFDAACQRGFVHSMILSSAYEEAITRLADQVPARDREALSLRRG